MDGRVGVEEMLRPLSRQARQLTPRRGTVAHLGNRGRCDHIHTGTLSLRRSCTTHAYSRSGIQHTANSGMRDTADLLQAFTRYSFTSSRVCTNQSSFDCPPPTCIAHLFAHLLQNYCAMHAPPPDPPFVCHTSYNISNCNIV